MPYCLLCGAASESPVRIIPPDSPKFNYHTDGQFVLLNRISLRVENESNLIDLCPSHAISFQNLKITLVPQKSVVKSLLFAKHPDDICHTYRYMNLGASPSSLGPYRETLIPSSNHNVVFHPNPTGNSLTVATSLQYPRYLYYHFDNIPVSSLHLLLHSYTALKDVHAMLSCEGRNLRDSLCATLAEDLDEEVLSSSDIFSVDTFEGMKGSVQDFFQDDR